MKRAGMFNLVGGGIFSAASARSVGRWVDTTAAMRRLVRGRAEARNETVDIKHGMSTAEAPTGVDRDLGRGPALPSVGSPANHDGADEAGMPGMKSLRSASPANAPISSRFLSAIFSNQAGSRPYKLFVPSGYRAGQPVPLIVMLHGCTQSPDDFAAGTRMNEAAEKQTMLVVYPGQTRSANIQKCWNWFKESQQRRNMGEPSLIAGITVEVMRNYSIDPQRVYVAGISAGGAAAAIMADAYPDLYAAIGVHSGLACGAAYNLSSAMAAMRGSQGLVVRTSVSASQAERIIVPTIVFHGDRDTTVHPRNARAVIAQSARSSELTMHTDDVHVAAGHDYSRSVGIDADGNTVVEQWVVHGGGHAWSGGSPKGSYTDPHGPDATSEMLRFFLEHPHSGRAGGDPSSTAVPA